MIDAPCFNCDKRCLGCHGNCPDYAEYSDSRKSENHKRAIECTIDNSIIEGSINRRKNARKPRTVTTRRYSRL